MLGKGVLRQDVGWLLLILGFASAGAAAVRAIRSGYLKRRQDGQPAPAITYLAAGLRLLIDAVAFNLVFPGGR